MKFNIKKSKVMLFNSSKIRDFTPELHLNGQTLEVVPEIKLIGIIICSNLKWNANTTYITKRANSKLWLLRRLKDLGANRSELLDIYTKQVRSILEFGVPVWHPGITASDSNTIERVQKCALNIILGENYNNYEDSLAETGLGRLTKRRDKLCLDFATKCANNSRFSAWFVPNLT